MATHSALIKWKLLQWLATPTVQNGRKYEHSFKMDDRRVYFSGNGEFTVEVERCARQIVSGGLTSKDEYGNHTLDKAGYVAAEEPKPTWKIPGAPKLSGRDWDVLDELRAANRHRPWAAPLDCGGSNGSHHSGSLTKLTRHGYAECRRAGGEVVIGDGIELEPRLTLRPKGSRYFRITEAGLRALLEEDKTCSA